MVVIGTGYWQTSFVLHRVEFEVAPHLKADALNGGCCARVGFVGGSSRRLTGLLRKYGKVQKAWIIPVVRRP